MTAIKDEWYKIEIELRRNAGAKAPDLYALNLCNSETRAYISGGDVSLSYAVQPCDKFRGAPIDIAAFVKNFNEGKAGGQEEGLEFGRWLHGRITAAPKIAEAWSTIRSHLRRRSLYMVVLIERGDPHAAEIPFELWADVSGFLFHRGTHAIVRSFCDMEIHTVSIESKTKGALIWANPQHASAALRIKQNVFDDHEKSFEDLAKKCDLENVPPLREAHRDGLKKYLAKNRPLGVVAIVAHGSTNGGNILLHAHPHGDYPNDPGHDLAAADLAAELARAETKLAFLWSCHSGRAHYRFGSLAEHLLDPNGGNLAAVVASPAAVNASKSVTMMDGIVQGLGRSGGRIERAVADARFVFDADDLEWAVPAFYARPRGAETATLEDRFAKDLEYRSDPPLEGSEFMPRSFRGQARAVEEIAATTIDAPSAPRSVRRPTAVSGAPTPTANFVGRVDVKSRLVALLGHERLISITGLPGIGKSETALAAANDVLADAAAPFDGAYWVALDGVKSVDSTWSHLARAAGIENVDSIESLCARIDRRPLLFLFDNAEDPLHADAVGVRTFIGRLLSRCPKVKLLVATRRRVGDVEGCRDVEVPIRGGLEFDDALQVFVDAAGPRLTEADRVSPDLDSLVRLLDGHPRSLVLVAKRVGRDVSLGELKSLLDARRVDDIRIDELTRDAKGENADDRARTRHLIAGVEVSYEFLEREHPRSAEIFRRLALFPGGLPSLLVDAIFGAGGTAAVGDLVRESLAEVRGRDRRLVLPAPLRWYAEKKLRQESVEARALGSSKIAAAIRAWNEANHGLLGSPNSVIAVARAVIDEPSMHEVWKEIRDLTNAGVASTGADAWAFAATAFSAIVQYGDRARLAIRLLEALQADASLFGNAARAAVLEYLGDLYLRTAQLEKAGASYLEALPIYRGIDARLGEANTLRALGDLYRRTDQLEKAGASYMEALPIYRGIDDRLGEANTLRALGDLYLRTAQLEKAGASYLEALPIYRGIDDRMGEASTRQGLAQLAAAHGRYRSAFNEFLECLPVFRGITDRLGEAGTFGYLTRMAIACEEFERAVVSGGAALRLLVEVSDRYGQGLALRDLLTAFARLGDLPAATAAIVLAHQAFSEIGHPQAAAMVAILQKLDPGFDASKRLGAEETATYLEVIADAVAAAQRRLDEKGIDPFSPLPEEPSA